MQKYDALYFFCPRKKRFPCYVSADYADSESILEAEDSEHPKLQPRHISARRPPSPLSSGAFFHLSDLSSNLSLLASNTRFLIDRPGRVKSCTTHSKQTVGVHSNRQKNTTLLGDQLVLISFALSQIASGLWA